MEKTKYRIKVYLYDDYHRDRIVDTDDQPLTEPTAEVFEAELDAINGRMSRRIKEMIKEYEQLAPSFKNRDYAIKDIFPLSTKR